MRCTNGHSLPSNAAFCPTCGAESSLFDTLMAEDLEAQNEFDLDDVGSAVLKRRVDLWRVLAVICLGVIGVATFFAQDFTAPRTLTEKPLAQAAPAAPADPVVGSGADLHGPRPRRHLRGGLEPS